MPILLGLTGYQRPDPIGGRPILKYDQTISDLQDGGHQGQLSLRGPYHHLLPLPARHG